MKRCGTCGETKPRVEFWRCSSFPDGLQLRCKPCHRAAAAKSKARHPDRAKAKAQRDAAWRKAKTRDARFNAQEQAVVTKVRDEHRMAVWREANRDRVRELSRRGMMRRYALKKGAAGYSSTHDVRMRWAYYGGKCWMCGAVATQTDHVIALNSGGSEWPANLRPACAKCNRAKSDRDHREFLATAV